LENVVFCFFDFFQIKYRENVEKAAPRTAFSSVLFFDFFQIKYRENVEKAAPRTTFSSVLFF
jgi:hypothetical protein